MRVGIADHLGWAVAVTASADFLVADRRRIELIEPGVPPMPIEHESAGLDDPAAAALVERARASAVRATGAAFDDLVAALSEPVVSISLRAWPPDFPSDIAVLRRPPYNARADGVMYRQVLADAAEARGWQVHLYDPAAVIGQASALLGDAAGDIFERPRLALGPPWTRDHRTALAAAILAG